MAALEVGDVRRIEVRRVLVSTLSLAVAFSLTTVSLKQFAPWYDHAPWVNDPYDTVVSFSIFFVPLLAGICAVRIPICRRSEPLAISRIRDLLRNCQVLVATISFTLTVEWFAVLLRANSAQWNLATGVQIAVLAVLSLTAVRATSHLRRAAIRELLKTKSDSPSMDWLSDVVLVASMRISRRESPRRWQLKLVKLVDSHLVVKFRRHSLWSTAAIWILIAGAVGAMQSLSEGYSVGLTALFVVLMASGMFSFSVAAGHFLGIVRSTHPLSPWRRRAFDAGVASVGGVLTVFAFRFHLWWLVASTNAHAGLSQLVVLLSMAAGAVFVAAIVVETLLAYRRSEVRCAS